MGCDPGRPTRFAPERARRWRFERVGEVLRLGASRKTALLDGPTLVAVRSRRSRRVTEVLGRSPQFTEHDSRAFVFARVYSELDRQAESIVTRPWNLTPGGGLLTRLPIRALGTLFRDDS